MHNKFIKFCVTKAKLHGNEKPKVLCIYVKSLYSVFLIIEETFNKSVLSLILLLLIKFLYFSAQLLSNK